MAELILKQLQGQLFTVISFLLCDRLSNKYHNVHVTNEHQLLFHFKVTLTQHLAVQKSFFSTSRCRFPYK